MAPWALVDVEEEDAEAACDKSFRCCWRPLLVDNEEPFPGLADDEEALDPSTGAPQSETRPKRHIHKMIGLLQIQLLYGWVFDDLVIAGLDF